MFDRRAGFHIEASWKGSCTGEKSASKAPFLILGEIRDTLVLRLDIVRLSLERDLAPMGCCIWEISQRSNSSNGIKAFDEIRTAVSLFCYGVFIGIWVFWICSGTTCEGQRVERLCNESEDLARICKGLQMVLQMIGIIGFVVYPLLACEICYCRIYSRDSIYICSVQY